MSETFEKKVLKKLYHLQCFSSFDYGNTSYVACVVNALFSEKYRYT